MMSLLKKRGLKQNEERIKSLIKTPTVVYADVDGTLVGPRGSIFAAADGGYTLAAAEAIITANQKGIDIVMVSGRSARQLFGDARLLGLKNYIAEMGCEIIYDCGSRILENFEFAKERGASLFEAIATSGAVELLFEKYPGCLEYHTPWSEGRNCTHVFRGCIDVLEAEDLLNNQGFDDLGLVDNGLIGRRGSLDKTLPEVHAYHLMPRGVSKAKGIAKDMFKRALAKESTIAIGDAISDIDMAEEVGAFFLVRNGLDSSKDFKEEILSRDNVFVTESKMGEGFAEVVSALLGRI